MIRAEHLTKKFGDFVAINDVSFQVNEGEVVGLLGVNGAGKTTTLRVLTGFYPASAGKVSVAGFDVSRNSLDVRRNIGYMPEATPLYGELRVWEYLKFRVSIKSVARRDRQAAVVKAMESAGLRDVSKQVIGTLSRGYRQRVGLADALLGSPKILILDEPTSGLDPLQRMQVRQVLRGLRQGHTVMLSTHILSEAEAACDRILIIHQGRLVPEEDIARLRRQGIVRVCLRADKRTALDALRTVSGVKSVEEAPPGSGKGAPKGEAGAAGETAFDVHAAEGADPREAIFRMAAERNLPLLEMRRIAMSLEDVFGRIALGVAGEGAWEIGERPPSEGAASA